MGTIAFLLNFGPYIHQQTTTALTKMSLTNIKNSRVKRSEAFFLNLISLETHGMGNTWDRIQWITKFSLLNTKLILILFIIPVPSAMGIMGQRKTENVSKQTSEGLWALRHQKMQVLQHGVGPAKP